MINLNYMVELIWLA